MNKQAVVFLLLVIVHGMALGANGAMTFGFHVHEPINIGQASRAGYGAIRLWDSATGWSSLQSYRGRWNFRRVETYLAESDKSNLKVLWVIGNTPRWASARPDEKCAYGLGCAAEPAHILDWRHYVRTIATRYRGRVECYEPWNEVSFPNDPLFSPPGAGGAPGQFFSGSVQSMVDLARIVYEEVKRVDPQACVLSPSFHPSGHWAEKFDRFLAAGGGQYADVISQHFYFAHEPEQTVPVIRAMRRVMEKHGVGELPVWNTEVGMGFADKVKEWPGLSAEELVYAMTLRTYLLNASEGVARVYWYAWDNRGMGLSATGLNPALARQAATAATGLLADLQAVDCGLTGDIWECRVRAADRQFKVVWLAGRGSTPRPVTFDGSASRWGPTPTFFPAGRRISLDARPVVVEDGA